MPHLTQELSSPFDVLEAALKQIEILLRHRLLRQPGGFEGFFEIEVFVHPDGLAVPDLDQPDDRRLGLSSAFPAASPEVTDRDELLVEVLDLRQFDLRLLGESLVGLAAPKRISLRP